jgi:hypothetical protein
MTISLFLKHVKQPDAAVLLSTSLRLDAIVKVIRFTNDHNILRNALSILALLAPIIPGRVVSIKEIKTRWNENWCSPILWRN